MILAARRLGEAFAILTAMRGFFGQGGPERSLAD